MKIKYLSGLIGTINRSGMDARRSLSEYSHYISPGFLNGKLRDFDLRWIEKRILDQAVFNGAHHCFALLWREADRAVDTDVEIADLAGLFSFSASTETDNPVFARLRLRRYSAA